MVSAVNGNTLNIGIPIVLPVSGATLTMSGNGDFSYDPTSSALLNALEVGQTFVDSFTYTISDQKGGFDTETVTVTVLGLNEPPFANSDNFAILENGSIIADDADNSATPADPSDNGVLANDTDPEGDPLTAVLVQGPQFHVGAFVLNPDGTFEYQHDGSESIIDESLDHLFLT